MTDLFETRIEALRQHIDVVAERFGCGMKRLVGHHRSRREIVGERDPVEAASRIVEGACAADDAFDRWRAFGKSDLEGKLERATRPVDQLRNQELTAMAFVPPQGLAHVIDR